MSVKERLAADIQRMNMILQTDTQTANAMMAATVLHLIDELDRIERSIAQKIGDGGYRKLVDEWNRRSPSEDIAEATRVIPKDA